MKITAIEIEDQEAADILTTAIESNGIRYWACNFGVIDIWRNDKETENANVDDGYIVKARFKADKEDGAGKPVLYTIDLESIKKAVSLALLPKHRIDALISQLVRQNIDSEGADVILQLACFEEVIYG